MLRESSTYGAINNYKEATLVCKELLPCNPLRLGIALNYAVFYSEVMDNDREACNIAEAALQAAMEKIDELDEEEFNDAKDMIELLKENLTLWKEEEKDNDLSDG